MSESSIIKLKITVHVHVCCQLTLNGKFSPLAKKIPPLLEETTKACFVLEKLRTSNSRLRFSASLEQKIQRWNSKLPLRRAAILATGGKVHAHQV